MLVKPEQNIVIQFLPLIRDARPYERIIVSEQSQIRLDGKCVGELRYTQSHNRTDHSVPPNLLNPSGTAGNRGSGIWAGFSSLPLGSRRTMEPRRSSGSPSKISSALHGRTSSTTSAAPASLLPPTETRKIESWAENIDEDVNPNEIVVEPPKELTQDETRIGRQRRVASADSDSDSDSDSADKQVTPVQPVRTVEANRDERSLAQENFRSDEFTDEEHESEQLTTSGRFKSDNSTDEEYAPTQAANPQINIARRRRVKTAESDDSSDEEPSFAITNLMPETGQVNSEATEAPTEMSGSPRRGSSPTNIGHSVSASVDLTAYGVRGSTPRRGRGAGTQPQSRGRAISSPISTRGGPSHSQNQPEHGRRGRWAPKQEAGMPGRNRGQMRTRGMGRDQNSSANPSRAGHQPGRGKPTQHGRFRGGSLNRGRGNGGAWSQSNSSDSNLVDIGPTVINSPVIPPPGLDIRVESPQEASLQSANLLDEPLHNIQRPSIPPDTSSLVKTPVNPPRAAGRSSHTSSSSGWLYVNTFNPRPNVAAMEEEQRQMLLAQREQLARARVRASNSQVGSASPSSEHPTASSSSARLQAHDEVSTRRFHRTMDQGAPNSSKKGKLQKREETKKEKEARIEKAMAEAHGIIPTARKPEKPSPKIGSSSDEVDKEMSARKRQALKKSGPMAESDPGAAEDELKQSQTTKLIESLKPIFEAGRAFSGKLRFEVQFGQVISAFSSQGSQCQFIDLQEWHRRFHPQLGILPEVASFTNVLTTNGADADRILEMKSPSPGSVTVWSRNEPIPREVSYEFQCQTKDNEQFWLVVNQNGTYELRPTPTTVGMINLHFPGQIWDACAVVAGVMNHRFAEPVEEVVKAFVSSLYIPPGLKKISITYRLPDTNEMTVRNLIMKRKSLHDCKMAGKHGFQLQITEVQTLYHQFHKDDKKLGQGFVKDYSQMINDGRLHYEVSLVHKGISELLEKNVNLELGELTGAWTEAEILSKEGMRSTVDLTTLVVSKIDGIGSKNIGTLFRKDVERMVEENQLTVDPAEVYLNLSRLNPDAASHIPGVRGGRADIVWKNGQPYAYGYGGAWVPIPDQRGSGSDEVVPDDSASQAGGADGAQMPIRTMHSAQAANISTSVQPRAEHGFW
jgi:hypothetical protein